jgi:hypothetical protein
MRYEVPRTSGEFASWPPVADLPEFVKANVSLRAAYRFNVLDVSFPAFARECVEDARAAAKRFAGDVGIEPADFGTPPVIATGHQPELFHAGVWIKNFLAARLARRMRGSSVNLIVDNDVPKHLGLIVPAREGGKARHVEAAFAPHAGEMAFEEYPAAVADVERFREELLAAADDAPFAPAARELVERLSRLSGRGRSVGDVLAALRISYERELGVTNAEFTVSRIADAPSFGVFAASILADIRAFAAKYNDALHKYRQDHEIRSHVNPMPDLAVEADAVEAPFWIWRRGENRARLLVRRRGDEIILLKDGEEAWRLPASSADMVRDAWRRMVDAGVKVRPRAITTTIFMRLFVSDLFIHGVGGAEYDEVADNLVRSFYGVEPPRFAVITATLTLPWSDKPVALDALATALRKRRDVEHNPQVFTADSPSTSEAARTLIERKWDLVREQPADHEGRQAKWEGIRDMNDRLRDALGLSDAAAAREIDELRDKIAAGAILFSRDYSAFLLGPRNVADFYDRSLAALVPSLSGKASRM